MPNSRKFWRPVTVLLMLLIVLFIAASAIGILCVKKYSSGSRSSSDGDLPGEQTDASRLKLDSGQLDSVQVDEEAYKRALENEQEGFVLTGNPEIEVKAGERTIKNIYLTNDAENTGKFYATFELRLPDSSQLGYEVLFRTDLIQPGNTLMDVTMSRALEAGEYSAVMFVQPYYIDTLGPTNNAAYAVKLKVK